MRTTTVRIDQPIVHYEWIRMPDSSGFGSYTESGLVIPARLHGEEVNFVSQMYLDDDPPIAAELSKTSKRGKLSGEPGMAASTPTAKSSESPGRNGVTTSPVSQNRTAKTST